MSGNNLDDGTDDEVQIVDESTDAYGHRVVVLDVDGVEVRVRGSELEVWPVDFHNKGDAR